MLRLTVKSLLARKIRLLLTMIAIVFGVAFAVATFVLTDSLRSTFNKLVVDIESGIDLTARIRQDFGTANDRSSISEDLVAQIRRIDGVKAADGRLFITPVVPLKPNGDDVTTSGAPVAGINYATDSALSQLIQKDGRPPQGPNEFNLDIDSAKKHKFTVGETYTIIGPKDRRQFTLVGTVAFNSDDNDTVGAVISVFDTPTAQEFFDRKGGFNEIAVQLANPGDEARVQQAVQALLPANGEVVSRSTKIEEGQDDFNDITTIFGNVLLAFAIVILVVSLFIINNTFQIVVGQRVRELGLLRALGATGKQVRRSVLLEALIIGIASTVAGLLLGLAVSRGLRALMNNIGFGLPDGPLRLAPRTIVVALVVGIGGTVVASLAPAWRSQKVSPMQALRDDARLPGAGARRRFIIGGLFAAIGLVLMAWGLFGDLGTAPLLGSIAAGALAIFVAVNMLSPVIAAPVSRALGRRGFGWVFIILGPLIALGSIGLLFGAIASLADGEAVGVLFLVIAPLVLGVGWLVFDGGLGSRGRTGLIARENAARNPRRTSSTAAALMIGLALVSMASVVSDSLKKSFLSTLDTAVQADWFVRPNNNFDPNATLPDEYTDALRKIDGVDSVVAYRFAFSGIQVNGESKDINSTDYPLLPRHLDLDVKSGDIASAPPNALLVHRDSAEDNNLSVGSPVEVTFPDGQKETLTVAAIHADATILGNWVISNDTWDKHFPRKQDQFVTLKLAAGADTARVRQSIDELGAAFPTVKAEDRADFKETQKQQVDSLLAVISVFLLLAIIIAFIGIVNTMSLSIFERTRELGLLRAVGTTRRQLRHLIKWEAGIVAMLGGVLGIVVGVLFGIAAVQAIPKSIIKTTSLPIGQLLSYLIAAGVAGLVAAWFPARRAAKLNVLDAIAHT